jgi:hypothetical protein
MSNRETKDCPNCSIAIALPWPEGYRCPECWYLLPETPSAELEAKLDASEKAVAVYRKRAERLEAFVTRNMHMHSPNMHSEHSWRFANHCMRGKGGTASEALWRSVEIDEHRSAIAAGGFDVSPCRSCGTPVVCLPDGLPLCKACAEKAE